MAILGADAVKNQKRLLKQLTDGLNAAYAATDKLEEEHEAARAIADSQEQADYYANHVIPAMDALREVIDELECICDHDYWPVPTYNDILFYA